MKRTIKDISLFLGLTLSLIPSISMGLVKESISIKTYAVKYTGDVPSVSEVLSNSPKCIDGQTYIGCTSWDVTFEYEMLKRKSICYISRPKVFLTGTITLPNISISDQSKRLVYEKFFNSLKDHEFQHIGFGRKLSTQFDAYLNSIRGISCNEIENAVNSKFDAMFNNIISEEKKFDLDTRHGINEGASYPFVLKP